MHFGKQKEVFGKFSGKFGLHQSENGGANWNRRRTGSVLEGGLPCGSTASTQKSHRYEDTLARQDFLPLLYLW